VTTRTQNVALHEPNEKTTAQVARPFYGCSPERVTVQHESPTARGHASSSSTPRPFSLVVVVERQRDDQA